MKKEQNEKKQGSTLGIALGRCLGLAMSQSGKAESEAGEKTDGPEARE